MGDLAWLLRDVSPKPDFHARERDAEETTEGEGYNGALQVWLRLDGWVYLINRLGRFDDPIAQDRGQAICAEIWRDAQQGDLDLSLNRYRPNETGNKILFVDILSWFMLLNK